MNDRYSNVRQTFRNGLEHIGITCHKRSLERASIWFAIPVVDLVRNGSSIGTYLVWSEAVGR